MVRLRLYGLSLDINARVVGFLEDGTGDAADVVVTLGELDPDGILPPVPPAEVWYTSPFRTATGVPVLRIRRLSSGHLWWRYSDGTEFLIEATGTRVHAIWPDPLTLEDTLVYLFGGVLGYILRLRGVISLHGSALAVGPHAIVLVGDQAAGKSTTTAAFARRGFPILADDVAALEDRGTSPFVIPGPPRLLLLPASVEALWSAPDDLPLVTPNWDKRYLDLTRSGFHYGRQPLSLGAIYFLGDRKPKIRGPIIRSLTGSEGLIRLVSNTYANKLLDPAMRAREFELLGRIARHVPLRQVHAPDDLSKLERLCDGILGDCESLGLNRPVTAR